MLSILSNPASLAAENQLNITNSALQSTLNQLSSGSRINSGADDAAGLAIANGLQANITALTQSARNANDGVGMLQVADGALAQVTTLLNRAVTLATESATGTVSDPQRVALDQEYQAIENEISRIGSATNYNGTAVFGGSTNVFLSDGTNTNQSYNTIQTTISQLSPSALGLGTSASAVLTGIANPAATKTITITDPNATGGSKTWVFTLVAALDTTTATNEVKVGSNLAQTMQNIADAVNGNTANLGSTYAVNSGVAGSVAGPCTSVSASNVTSTSLTLTASVPGTNGNAISVASTDANVSLYTTNGTAGDLGGDLARWVDSPVSRVRSPNCRRSIRPFKP